MNNNEENILKTQLIKELKAPLSCHIIKIKIDNKEMQYKIRSTEKEIIEVDKQAKNKNYEKLEQLIIVGFENINNRIEKNYQELNQKIENVYKELSTKIDDINKKLDDHIVEFNNFKLEITKKLDDHIVEFKEFKSETNAKFDLLFSLPTITREIANK